MLKYLDFNITEPYRDGNTNRYNLGNISTI